MAFKVQILSPIEDQAWNRRLLPQGEACVFHTSNWAAVLCATYGFAPCCLAVDPTDQGEGMLPLVEVRSVLTGRRGVSLPFTDSCPLLASGEGVAAALFAEACELARRKRWRYIELRGGAPLPGNPTPSLRYYEHRIALPPDSQQLFDTLKSPVRTAIRKAVQNGVTVEVRSDLEAVNRFYRLNCLTRRMHGLPPQPFRFFWNLQQFLLGQEMGSVVLASVNGETIAGALFLHFGTTATFKYGASDPKASHLRPNNLVMWEGIRSYIERGFRSINLGRTNLDHEGLRRFKLGWGAEERHLVYHKYDTRSQAFVQDKDAVSGWHNAVFRRLPIPFAKLFASWVYRHAA